MDKIKKYKQFKELDYDDIKERFGNAIDEVGGDSYSRIYREYRDNADLEDELYTELIKNGLDDEILKKHLQKLAADFSDENGIVDLFFYTYLKKWNLIYKVKEKMDGPVIEKEYPLSGYLLSDSDTEELFIKYKYGCHNTYYGRLLIKQSFNTIDDFFNELGKNFKLEFVNNIEFSIFDDITRRKINNDNYLREEVKKMYMSNCKRDKNIIEIDWYSLYNDIESILPTKFDNHNDFYNSIMTQINNSMTSNIEDVNGRKIKITFDYED